MSETTDALATFDFAAFFAAVDEARRGQGLHWYAFADELWDLSVQLNAERDDHPLCGGAVSRLGARGETSCQFTRSTCCAASASRPRSSSSARPWTSARRGSRSLARTSRLRWDLAQLHAAVDEQRRQEGLTWARLADHIGCTPARLTGLRRARMADMALAMRLTQWLRRPAADFIHPASSRHRAELL